MPQHWWGLRFQRSKPAHHNRVSICLEPPYSCGDSKSSTVSFPTKRYRSSFESKELLYFMQVIPERQDVPLSFYWYRRTILQ